jgi:hypothetical protein
LNKEEAMNIEKDGRITGLGTNGTQPEQPTRINNDETSGTQTTHIMKKRTMTER